MELLPCPFCGSEPSVGFVGDDDGGYGYIECPICNGGHDKLFCGIHFDVNEQDEAAAAWNRREKGE